MDSFRIGKVDKKAINETLLAMNRNFQKQHEQNESSYNSMLNMYSYLKTDLALIDDWISKLTYQNTYMKSLIESL